MSTKPKRKEFLTTNPAMVDMVQRNHAKEGIPFPQPGEVHLVLARVILKTRKAHKACTPVNRGTSYAL